MSDITQQFEAIQDNVRRFWDVQDRLLDNMQKFADGWFERRHAGCRAIQEATQRMCKAQTPEELAREYQNWVTGAIQRVTDDCLAHRQFAGAFAGLSEPQQLERRTLARAKAA